MPGGRRAPGQSRWDDVHTPEPLPLPEDPDEAAGFRIPAEYRHLFDATALRALEGVQAPSRSKIDRPRSTPSDGQDPIEHVATLLEVEMVTAGRLPSVRVDAVRAKWVQQVKALTGEGFTAGQVGDVVIWMSRNAPFKASLSGFSDVADNIDRVVATKEFQRWAALRADPQWDFPAPEPVPAKTGLQDRRVMELCLRLRERVEENRNVHLHPASPRTVQISEQWLKAADLMLRRDGVAFEVAVDVLEWSTRDEFWRTNVLSMTKLRTQMTRLSADGRFLRWREMQQMRWTPAATALVQSMQGLLQHAFKAPQTTPPHAWFAGAEEIMQHYSLDDVEDAMEWCLTDPWYRGRVTSLVTSVDAVSRVRRETRFVAWSRERGRAWAFEVALPAGQLADGRERSQRAPELAWDQG